MATATALVLLGHVAEVCHNCWYAQHDDTRWPRENLIHALLSFILIAELEFWRSDVCILSSRISVKISVR